MPLLETVDIETEQVPVTLSGRGYLCLVKVSRGQPSANLSARASGGLRHSGITTADSCTAGEQRLLQSGSATSYLLIGHNLGRQGGLD